jgi:spore cortex formation protein SpoVR/YcgB (stage V sporulation)
VINSDPCIAYLMEENTICMQALVIAHACYGHNSFFKGNYLFRTWTDASSIIDYLVFAKQYIMQCEERYGIDAVEELLDSCHALMNYGVDRYKRPLSHLRRGRTAAPEGARGAPAETDQRLVAHHSQKCGQGRREGQQAFPRRTAGKTSSTSWKNTRPCSSPGSVK